MKQLLAFSEKCTGCRHCEANCLANHLTLDGKNESPRLSVIYHRGRYYPWLCRHCTEAPCIDACVSGAMRRNPRTGFVYVDSARCRGCWMCIMSCPFGVIQADKAAGRAYKCDGCPGRVVPACVASCEAGALTYAEEATLGAVRRRGLGCKLTLEDQEGK